MHVTIIGAGYVGLVSAACLSDFGHQVICVDKDRGKIVQLRQGIIPIFEPGLEELVKRNVKVGRLSFTDDLVDAVGAADVVMLAVGTPSRRGDGLADISFVMEAAAEIATALRGYTVVVMKSTVPVGTGDQVHTLIKSARPQAEFTVVSNPEFLREGAAIDDFKRPDRIVVGTLDEHARAAMRELYRPLFINETPIMFTDRRTAELSKYAANAFLATKVTFINEIANLCEKVGANVQDVARAMGLDRRIGSKFLHAGPGFGGSCFPKDTAALVATGIDCGAPLHIVEAVIAVNDERKREMADKIVNACGGIVSGKTIAVLGVTFKPNTDDLRDAPSLVILPALVSQGAQIKIYDPVAMEAATRILTGIVASVDPYACVAGADALVILTEWDEFRALDFEQIKSVMREPVIIDLRNIYRPDEMRRMGFTYVSIGRG